MTIYVYFFCSGTNGNKFQCLTTEVKPTATFAVLVVAFALNVATSASVVLISSALKVEIEWVNLQSAIFIYKRGFWMHNIYLYIIVIIPSVVVIFVVVIVVVVVIFVVVSIIVVVVGVVGRIQPKDG